MTGGARILLGDNKGGGALMLLTIRFHCVRVWNSTGFFILRQMFKIGVTVAQRCSQLLKLYGINDS
jgi:hypothetical protein